MVLKKIEKEKQETIERAKALAQEERNKIAETSRIQNRRPVEILIEDTLKSCFTLVPTLCVGMHT